MDETIYVIFKVQFDFALEVWFSIYITLWYLKASFQYLMCILGFEVEGKSSFRTAIGALALCIVYFYTPGTKYIGSI